MLDINLIREKPHFVRQNLARRNIAEYLTWFDDLLRKDKEYRDLLKEVEGLRALRNKLSKEVSQLKKEGKDTSQILKQVQDLPKEIKEKEEKFAELKTKVDHYLLIIPNILHESVPDGKSAEDNKVIRAFGEPKIPSFELKPHGELLQELDLADFERGAKVAGKGFSYLIGDFALLSQAVQQFAIQHLAKKGYLLVEPPFMLNRSAYEGTVVLEDFENVMYKAEGEDLYLIATSEHPLVARFKDETIDESKLPIKMAGISQCFRKEIGSHGVDERGLFRVHQFTKIEQVVFCKPEDSWRMHEELLQNVEEIFQELKIPYRIVALCSADMGKVMSKTYDLEFWSPRAKTYKEGASCSNAIDYQARRLNIKGGKEGANKYFVHTLNSTAVAVGRALIAIVENYQQKDGTIKVPNVLVPYMNGKKVIG
ncbi:MAG: serine--tRNA ligase [Candidatus Woesearchaeota archaeon]